MKFLWIVFLLSWFDSPLINGACINYPDFPNGNTTVRQGNHVLFQCHKGYKLQGRPIFTANFDGVLRGIMPFCSKAGCKTPNQPSNGILSIYDGLKAVAKCKDNYVLFGYGVAYCNGTQWSNELGYCQKPNRTDYSCGFETEDLCGWTTSEVASSYPWKRVSNKEYFPSKSSSKKFVNLEKGHFMRVEPETDTRSTSVLTSPIYPRSLSAESSCCFGFQYFICGHNHGYSPQLEMHVKLVPKIENKVVVRSIPSRIWKFSNPKIGEWVQDAAIIPELKYDFQVTITAENSGLKLWDMAIDNVTLLTGNDCWDMFSNLKKNSIECTDDDSNENSADY
ncbi:uncharacterized protein Dana_GF27772, isoform A [Drosophila ananassae]|uniref:Uncharacterized protein, isoform A n=1 Tax=Drosophila ananassae TaxID=7217 RepID=A0A0P8XI64_DROAN|nr:MAM domain-containing glycosylphosphatidylinositol anchor protein 1 isoform X2 [Drosophila ananassae]KPU74491.1 uncharacterized protein Dana_GF27772, isoform A [Drosophila ananassae]